MDWLQILALIFGNAAIFIPLWLHLDNKMHDQSGKASAMIQAQSEKTTEIITALSNTMAQESKDFHGRLCALEEKYMQMMERLLEKK